MSADPNSSRRTAVAPAQGAWVRVPASTSNLGPGFDVLGLAMDLFLTAHFHPGSDSFVFQRGGTLREIPGPPGDDLLLSAFSETLDEMARVPGGRAPPEEALPPGRLVVDSEIPVGKGLGSSAAALAAGRILGLLVADRAIVPDAVVDWIARREGHPDNAAPSVLGGLVAASLREGSVEYVRLPVSPSLGWAFAAPAEPLDTRASRGALPAIVPHEAAVRNASRLARLLPALEAGEGAALSDALGDELHVPYRLPLIPGAVEAVQAGVEAGAWGVTLSGAGSGLIAIVVPEAAERVARAMAAAFEAIPGAASAYHRVLVPWDAGSRWGKGDATPDPPGSRASSPG